MGWLLRLPLPITLLVFWTCLYSKRSAVLVQQNFSVRKVTCFGSGHMWMPQDLLRFPFLLSVILRLPLLILLFTFFSLLFSIFSVFFQVNSGTVIFCSLIRRCIFCLSIYNSSGSK